MKKYYFFLLSPILFTVIHDLVINLNILHLNFDGFGALVIIPIFLGYAALSIIFLFVSFIIGLKKFLIQKTSINFMLAVLPFIVAGLLIAYLQIYDLYNIV